MNSKTAITLSAAAIAAVAILFASSPIVGSQQALAFGSNGGLGWHQGSDWHHSWGFGWYHGWGFGWHRHSW